MGSAINVRPLQGLQSIKSLGNSGLIDGSSSSGKLAGPRTRDTQRCKMSIHSAYSKNYNHTHRPEEGAEAPKQSKIFKK